MISRFLRISNVGPETSGTESTRHRVCVVIPTYKAELSFHEQVSLTQCRKVLGVHPIVFIAPEGLDLPYLQSGERVCRFLPDCFSGIDGYNRLLLSDSFYQAFDAFEYILIHQLDCFVFRDDLLKWCDVEYDYIGAPWILPVVRHHEWRARAWAQLVRWRGKRLPSGARQWNVHHFGVGNGGFSLRRVDAMRRTLKALPQLAKVYSDGPARRLPEDIFFGIEANYGLSRSLLSIPDWRSALRFAFETHPSIAYRRNHHQLPFGCHDWVRIDYGFWKPHIQACGYSIP